MRNPAEFLGNHWGAFWSAQEQANPGDEPADTQEITNHILSPGLHPDPELPEVGLNEKGQPTTQALRIAEIVVAATKHNDPAHHRAEAILNQGQAQDDQQ